MAELKFDEMLDFVMDLVKRSGDIINSRSSEKPAYQCKNGVTDLLTKTDKEIEDLLIKSIHDKYPTHKFIAEESANTEITFTDDPTWIIDPVDGTMNFVHGFPHSCISIALYVNKIAEIGIVHNPMLNQTFKARRGMGAYYNDRKINVSGEKILDKALIMSEFGTSRDEDKLYAVNENFTKLSKLVHGIRTLGSAALNISMVALGAADANYEMGIHAWDIAAGSLIVTEAGGVVLDPSGGEFDIMSRRVLAASSIELATEIVEHLTQYYPMPRDDD